MHRHGFILYFPPMAERFNKLAKIETDSEHPGRLETLLKNLPGMAYRCLNLDHWPMSFVSEGCFELCGYHRHEIESQTVLWGDFTHPEDIDEVDRKVRAAAISEKPFEVEYRIIARSGEEKWVWERGRLVDFRDDGVAILEGLITDITDRKLTETALIQTEAFAQAVIESAVEAVITIDDQGGIESINQASETMFGHRLNEIRGQHSRLLVPTGHYSEFDRYLMACRDSIDKRAIDGDFNGISRDGIEFPIHLTISEIHSENNRKYVLLIRDLSSQRAAEKEVREQRELLAHVDRVNTLGEMATGIAHEINQPLTAISMYAQTGIRLLRNDPLNRERLGDALNKLSHQAHRAGAVIERMQEMTKQRESHQEIIDCSTLIREVHRLAEVEAHLRNFVIFLRLDSALPKIKCDPIQVQQVILNLLRNGMESMKTDHCPTGSKIILQAEVVDHRVKISIIDCGLGISMQIARELFQPFTSTKDSGMGMGLSISYSIVAAHGGKLTFSNNKHHGATFSFCLPPVANIDQ